MSGDVLNDGRPVHVPPGGDRVGHGPWARWFATAVVPDERSPAAERGRALARGGDVHTVSVTAGLLAAQVVGGDGNEHTVTLAADSLPPRLWAAISRSARGNAQLEAAVDGRAQSVRLEHLMTVDWSEPLVPRAHSIRRACTCADPLLREGAGACHHVAALAYVIANEIDRDPSLLLRWRGCVSTDADGGAAPVTGPTGAVDADAGDDPWLAGPLPAPRPVRLLPPGAVLKRLGPSGLRVGGEALEDLLERAYASFAEPPS